MNSKIEALEKKRRRLRQNKQISFVAKLIFYFVSFFLLIKFLPDHEYTSYIIGGCLIFLALIFSLISTFYFRYPYEELKEDYNKELLKSFIDEYHPNVKWTFNHRLQLGRTLFRKDYDDYKITHQESYELKHNDFNVTSSRIFFQHENNKRHRTFQILNFTLKGKNFPKTVFNKKRELGMLNTFTEKHNYLDFRQIEDSKLLYATENLKQFKKEINPILSLLIHLGSKVKTFYVKLEGQELFIIFDKPIFTLDADKKNIKDTFLDKAYAENLGKKINTLLILADSFDNGLEKTETEERLELKMLEIIKDNKTD